MDRGKRENGVNDDVDLDEFADDIDEWILAELKNIGCDTARSVLKLNKEELDRLNICNNPLSCSKDPTKYKGSRQVSYFWKKDFLLCSLNDNSLHVLP